MIDNDTNTTEPLQAAVGTEPQMVGYVTFLADGTLDGSYFQVPPEEHLVRMIEVDDAIRAAWVNYRANDARDGVDPLPPAAPAPVDLDALKAAAIGRTYADVDAVYDAAIGRRATEYQDAEVAARAFADAGYAGDASEYVSDYALHNPTGEEQTNQWAAEQIIARADAFRAAQKAMRTQRFASQAALRTAATPEQLAAAQAAWDGFIAATRADLRL
jgi:hypothetical protein